MTVILTIAIAGLILCLNEALWRHLKKHNELSRKAAHILVGVFTAFWPFYLSFKSVRFLSLALFIAILFSGQLKFLRSLHNVERTTHGILYSALSVVLLSFLTHNKWLFAASLLQMALADGLAAVIGVTYGKNNQYKILGHTKSIIGSLAFFVTSLIILLAFNHAGHLALSPFYLGLVSLIATGLENLGIKGLDNVFVPLVVLLMLTR
jgi:phytol kinase